MHRLEQIMQMWLTFLPWESGNHERKQKISYCDQDAYRHGDSDEAAQNLRRMGFDPLNQIQSIRDDGLLPMSKLAHSKVAILQLLNLSQ